MRSFAAVILATAFLASNAFAAGNESRAPLVPGKPAGVKAAQLDGTPTLLLVAGVGIVAAGIALSASGDNNSIVSVGTTSSTTTTTSTTKTSTSTGTTT